MNDTVKTFDLAKKIRSLPDNELRIIFFSNYPQYMNLGYDVHALHMSTENSVKRSLKTRSLLTKFGTCSIATTGAVTFS